MTQFRIVLPLFAGLAVACAAAARAQPAASPDSGSDDATVVEAPASPAAAPPAPASLPATPLPARPSAAGVPGLAIALPPGMEPLPLGGFRLRFVAGSEAPPAAAQSSLAVLGQALAAIPAGRIVLTGQASGPAADVSVARRLSLARALAVKQALADGGLAATRIDIRPMGRTADAVDAVDVQPPLPEPAR